MISLWDVASRPSSILQIRSSQRATVVLTPFSRRVEQRVSTKISYLRTVSPCLQRERHNVWRKAEIHAGRAVSVLVLWYGYERARSSTDHLGRLTTRESLSIGVSDCVSENPCVLMHADTLGESGTTLPKTHSRHTLVVFFLKRSFEKGIPTPLLWADLSDLLVGAQGLEPWTRWLRVSCSTNWAMRPFWLLRSALPLFSTESSPSQPLKKGKQTFPLRASILL